MNGKFKIFCAVVGIVVVVGGWIYSYATTQNKASQNATDIEAVKRKHYDDTKAFEAKQDRDHDILIEVRSDVKHLIEAVKRKR